MSKNQAAYLVAKSARPLEVKSAPYTSPGPNEIVVKNGAVAVNPVGEQYPVLLFSHFHKFCSGIRF
jgi:hypothetical protein